MAKNYSFLKTLKKVGISLVQVFIAGALALATEDPEWVFLVPVLEGLRNWWKHRN